MMLKTKLVKSALVTLCTSVALAQGPLVYAGDRDETDPEPNFFNIDHFQCYEAKGKRVRRFVDLEDRFGSESDVRVGKPKLFCNPVSKDGEAILNEEDHLTCYEIDTDFHDNEGHDGQRRRVYVENQFGVRKLKVDEPEFLCVPSHARDRRKDHG